MLVYGYCQQLEYFQGVLCWRLAFWLSCSITFRSSSFEAGSRFWSSERVSAELNESMAKVVQRMELFEVWRKDAVGFKIGDPRRRDCGVRCGTANPFRNDG